MVLNASITVSGSELRRRMQEARRQLEHSAQFRRQESRCPAGRFIAMTRDGSPGCLCAIEGEPISLARQPSSLVDFCFGEHARCPTWRAEVDRIAAGRKTAWAAIASDRKARELVPVGDDESVMAVDGDRPGRDRG